MATNPRPDHSAAGAAIASSDCASPTATNDTSRRFPDYDVDDDLDHEFAAASSSSSFCLCFPANCFGRRSAGPHSYLLQINQDHYSEGQETRGGGGTRRWVVEKLKKAREVSEVVAGPKWKNFIRRFSGTVRAAVGSVSGGKVKSRSSTKVQFQYDAQSYALNFDDGVDTADDCGYPGFSARYAAPSTAAVGSNGLINKAVSQIDT